MQTREHANSMPYPGIKPGTSVMPPCVFSKLILSVHSYVKYFNPPCPGDHEVSGRAHTRDYLWNNLTIISRTFIRNSFFNCFLLRLQI